MDTASVIKIHENDNVAVALKELKAGESVCLPRGKEAAPAKAIKILSDIPFGHKIALKDIREGEALIKYGSPIGLASRGIRAGEHVHSHNLSTGLKGLLEYKYSGGRPYEAHDTGESFMGYLREDGSAGTRNEIWIIPTVSCVNHTANVLAELARKELQSLAHAGGPEYSGIDGIYAFPHNSGCSQMGEDQEITQRMLANFAHHPNAGAVLFLSLGCENNNWGAFEPFLGDYDRERIRVLVTQEAEGDEIEAGLELIRELCGIAGKDKREALPLSKLKIGFKCGGSDAFSGITANPLCGKICEWLVSAGGTGILTEVPEMFGAEERLMERAVDEAAFNKIVSLINDFKKYYMKYDQPIYENPAPGNKAGGITTLEEKSLGCIQKGGLSTVTDTLGFAERSRKAGLNLMTGPGNDNVSITNLPAAGANIILFTTGRGNPLGGAVPTLKIASNSILAERKKNWIDFNAGVLAEGASWEEAFSELRSLVLETASGIRRTKCEDAGYREIMIFKDGPIL